MDLITIGVNHKTAPLDIREKLVFSSSEIFESLKEIKKEKNLIKESSILSTCNRTELYLVTTSLRAEVIDYIFNFIYLKKGINLLIDEKISYILNLEQSIKHIFEVASGLDSMAVGENQILGQIKQAYSLSCQAGTNGIILNKLFHNSFRVGKRVRSETDIGSGVVSVSSIAVEMAQKIFKDISSHPSLLIGAGETGELTAQLLKEKGIKKLFIANRTFSKAEDLAKKMEAEAIPFDKITEILNKVDIVISSTGSAEPIIILDQMKSIMNFRNHRPIFIIDIAVPRDFEPEINKLYNVFLYSIDDLQTISDKNLARRFAEIPKAEAIIEEEVKKFFSWFRSLKVSPLIQKLKEKVEHIRNAEIQKNKKYFKEENIEMLDIFAKSLVNKILHGPMTKIKEFNEDSEIGLLRLDTIREIFELEKTHEKNEN
ncbi:MAG: glutamyl-tRNA reductase [Acidobacteriota bacterium]